MLNAILIQFQKLDVGDNYCGQHEMNNPIDGSKPISANAAAKFTSTASSVTVAVVADYTVAFVGTTSGHIKKVGRFFCTLVAMNLSLEQDAET